jgi:propionyl-CoA carboxylase alpha chain
VREGSEISIHYDPMIAKLVTHAATRAEAIKTQALALDAFALDGIRHNLPFLSAVMHHERWREGRLSTGFIAEEFPKGFMLEPPEGERAREVAAVAVAVDAALNRRRQEISGRMGRWRNAEFAAERLVRIGEQTFATKAALHGEETGVTFLDPRLPALRLASGWRPGEPAWLGTIDGRAVAMRLHPILNGFRITHAGTEVDARVHTRLEAKLDAMMPKVEMAGAGSALTCPMPGLVKAISVKAGQEVKAGDTLCIVEAMKMENVLRAERDAKVAAIRVKEGDTLAVDAVIMEFA